jgi:cell wall-associated NlpC family hydrolase
VSAYSRRLPSRYRRTNRTGPVVAAAVFAALLAASGAKETGHARAAAPAAAGSVAAEAIAYARGQLGKPYQWAATGPYSFDCSGLVMEAYSHAGVHIARTSQDQWATERHVSSPQPGDLAFFAGSDGTMTSPGHVGIVTGPHTMIEAYGTGYPIRVVSYDRPDLVGFSQPWGDAR